LIFYLGGVDLIKPVSIAIRLSLRPSVNPSTKSDFTISVAFVMWSYGMYHISDTCHMTQSKVKVTEVSRLWKWPISKSSPLVCM